MTRERSRLGRCSSEAEQVNHNHLAAGSSPATATSRDHRVCRLPGILLLVWAAWGCGDPLPPHGHPQANFPPQISNLRFSPRVFSKGEAGGVGVISGQVDFCDFNGDVVTLRTTTQNPQTRRTDVITDRDVRGLAAPLIGSTEFCTNVNDLPETVRAPIIARQVPFIGTLPFSLLVSTTLTGDREFLIQAIGARGQTTIAQGDTLGREGGSNVAVGRFSVPP